MQDRTQIKVLIIEDEEVPRFSTEELLRELGFTHVTQAFAFDGPTPEAEEIEALIRDHDLILIDGDLRDAGDGRDYLHVCKDKKVINISLRDDHFGSKHSLCRWAWPFKLFRDSEKNTSKRYLERVLEEVTPYEG